jgi:hypothetical protein
MPLNTSTHKYAIPNLPLDTTVTNCNPGHMRFLQFFKLVSAMHILVLHFINCAIVLSFREEKMRQGVYRNDQPWHFCCSFKDILSLCTNGNDKHHPTIMLTFSACTVCVDGPWLIAAFSPFGDSRYYRLLIFWIYISTVWKCTTNKLNWEHAIDGEDNQFSQVFIKLHEELYLQTLILILVQIIVVIISSYRL